MVPNMASEMGQIGTVVVPTVQGTIGPEVHNPVHVTEMNPKRLCIPYQGSALHLMAVVKLSHLCPGKKEQAPTPWVVLWYRKFYVPTSRGLDE